MWSKYHVSAREDRTYDGIVFDSKAEMEYYREVVLPLAAAGEIVQYELQKSFVLQPGFRHDGKAVRAITYVCDFYLIYKDGHSEVIDVKGMATPEAKLKRKMFLYKYPEENLLWVKKSGKHSFHRRERNEEDKSFSCYLCNQYVCGRVSVGSKETNHRDMGI